MICRRITFALLLGFSVAAVQAQPKPATPGSKPAANSSHDEDSHVYRNPTFAFRFQIPYGWVDRTKEMRDQGAPQPDDQDKKEKPAKQKAAATGEVLLAVFERPPDAIGETINSAVVIASEGAAAYPGLKKAEDYLGPLTELTTSKGFKVEGDPDISEIDAHLLIRADFTKPLSDKLTMHQSTLILLAKGQIVSFTFIAGSEDEIDDLIDGLHFRGMQPKR
ncbi:MAG: hypothetical protein WA172_22430 [Terriglobales bacterium]